MPLTEIEFHTKAFAGVHSDLSDLIRDLNDEIDRAKRKRLADIKRLVARCAEKHSTLKAAIEAEPDLFVKPRTYVFHGVKVGLQKGKGGIEWDDADRVVELIHKTFKDDAPGLLHITEKPDKEMLEKLPAADLKKLGCTIVDAGDIVVIKPTDSEVDKVVNALLKDAVDDASQEAA
jgi:hypothetical protein